MDNKDLIEEIIRKVLENMDDPKALKHDDKCCKKAGEEKLSEADYPLIEKRKDLIKTNTGKSIDDINLSNVLDGKIGTEDIKITAEVLLYQAEIAESVRRYAFAKNLRRASELTKVPDQRVLEIYNSLRPYRSTKQELLSIADELEIKYGAVINANFVREAAGVYENRNRLKAE